MYLSQDFIPLIKFLRGDAFGDKHWSELCTILKISSKSIDKLVFGDFLKAQDLIVANLDFIQVSCSILDILISAFCPLKITITLDFVFSRI